MKKNKRQYLGFEENLDGMVVLQLPAIHTEVLLSLLSMQHISLYQVRRTEEDVYFAIRLDDFHLVQKLLRQQHWRFRICSKKGVPFFISRLKRRKGLWAGLICCIFLGHLMLSCLWGYEVSGNERYSDAHVIALVQQYGLWQGCRRDSFNYEEIEHKIELEHPEFTWVQLEIKGTTLCISVKERLADSVELQTSGSIVAKTEGKLTLVRTYTGTALVGEGDWVTAEQVLIGGWMYPDRVRNTMGEFVNAGEPYAVRAKGEIWGERAYRAIGVCTLEESCLQYTGQQETKVSILWHEHVLASVGAKTSPYPYSEDTEEIRTLFQWGKWYCPIKICNITYQEKAVMHHSYTEEEAYQTALERARRQIQQKVPQSGKFIRESSGICRSTEDGAIQVEVIWIVEEPLGVIKQVPLPETLPLEKGNQKTEEN